jgi:hypothetical protein
MMNNYQSPLFTRTGTSTIAGTVQSSTTGGHWVETQSPEFDSVRYLLTAASAHLGTIDKLTVWKINNLDLQYKFERRSSGMLRLFGWLNTDSLTAENSLEHLINRGFTFDSSKQRGLSFTTGNIKSIPDYAIGTELCFVFFEAAVGRAFVYDRDIAQALIPHGYDSLYISPKPLDRNRDGKFSLHEYQLAASFDNRESSEYAHQYFIADVNQVSPKYIVRFRLQKTLNQLSAVEQLRNIINTSVEDVQFIDPITLQPSLNSIMGSPGLTSSTAGRLEFSPLAKSSVSLGGLDKRVLTVEKVYQQAMDELSYCDNDPSIMAKEQWLSRQLSTIEDKVREINLNYVDVLEAIEDAARAAKQKLQQTVREKLELCLSMEIELRRQHEQMDWMQGTVSLELKKYQQAIADAHGNDPLRRKLMLQFLKLWKQHNLTRNGLSRSKPNELQALSNVHADVRVQPDIRLFTDPFYTMEKKPQELRSDGGGSVGKQGSIISGQKHLQQFTSRAKTMETFAPAVAPAGQALLPAPIQSVIDQEMESLQQLILNEATSGAFRLPQSITRPLVGGNNPPLPLHAALDWLKQDPTGEVVGNGAVTNALDTDVVSALENDNTDTALRSAFVASFPYALGYKPEGELLVLKTSPLSDLV